MYTQAHRTTRPNHPERSNNHSPSASRSVAAESGASQHALSATERIHRALFSDYVSQRSNPARPVR